MTTLPAASSRLALWLLIAAVAVWLALNRDHLDPALIESAIHDLGLLAPLGHVVLFALGTILFVPGAIYFGGRSSISPARPWVRRPHSSLRATRQRIGSDES